ncbi:MAG: poly-gamma-glutamate biosynthesis protein PgsC [Myxococcota bacterium]
MSPADLLVLSIAVGIVVSFLFSEVYGLAAGGVVVPGYIALYLTEPYALGLTLGCAAATFAITKVISSFVIVYGRRRTSLTILIGFALGASVGRVDALPSFLGEEQVDLHVIGYIIPGLIAIWFDRQGIAPTTASLAIAATVVRLVLLLAVGPIVLQGAT